MTTLNSIIINLIIVIVLFPFKGMTQEIDTGKQDEINLQSTDVYLVKLHVDSVYLEQKFKLRSIFGNQSYKICKVKIKDVYYMGDSSYVNNKQLWIADFMLYKDDIIISHDTTINVSLFASSMKNVYFMGRYLPENELSASEYNYHALITNVDIKKRKLCRFLSENR
ncbi:MAG: hypothetical protein B6D64_08470 [Bacteroidetes bacterium 4484_276]|nr:MAG: hypothetical protein B6D64_08470 [Bacteroidetes bacterium 4484_276]